MNPSAHSQPVVSQATAKSKSRTGRWVVARLAATALAVVAASTLTAASAHPSEEKPGSGPLKVDPLVGYWVGTVTVVDCQSGTPFFTFDSGQLINHGGTINTTDYTNPPTSGGPGFGIWHLQRDGSYFVRFRFVQYTPDGQVSGFRVVSKTVTLANADMQTSVIRSAALDPQGNLLGTRCATEVASRFK